MLIYDDVLPSEVARNSSAIFSNGSMLRTVPFPVDDHLYCSTMKWTSYNIIIMELTAFTIHADMMKCTFLNALHVAIL